MLAQHCLIFKDVEMCRFVFVVLKKSEDTVEGLLYYTDCHYGWAWCYKDIDSMNKATKAALEKAQREKISQMKEMGKGYFPFKQIGKLHLRRGFLPELVRQKMRVNK